jgi:DNA-binding NarL/FixJ family response regulator
MYLVDEGTATERSTERIRVGAAVPDPLLRAGLERLLEPTAELVTAVGGESTRPDLVLAVLETVDESAVRLVRSLPPGTRVLLVVAQLDTDRLALAVRLGVMGVLHRSALDRRSLCAAVVAVANGEAVYPPDLLGALLGQVGDVAQNSPPVLTVLRLSPRETAVLRQLADGADTREIARTLSYSERTVKSVVQDVTRRFGVRNRPQAVAYALRHGLI